MQLSNVTHPCFVFILLYRLSYNYDNRIEIITIKGVLFAAVRGRDVITTWIYYFCLKTYKFI